VRFITTAYFAVYYQCKCGESEIILVIDSNDGNEGVKRPSRDHASVSTSPSKTNRLNHFTLRWPGKQKKAQKAGYLPNKVKRHAYFKERGKHLSPMHGWREGGEGKGAYRQEEWQQ
jgi:hypothetical protein